MTRQKHNFARYFRQSPIEVGDMRVYIQSKGPSIEASGRGPLAGSGYREEYNKITKKGGVTCSV